MDSVSTQPATQTRTILGLDIGGSKTAIVEGTSDGRILQRHEIATEGARPFEETYVRLVALLRQTVEAARGNGREVIAVSASLPGPLRIEEGVFIDPPNLLG